MIESSQANLEAVVAFAEKTWNGGGLVSYADFRQRTAAVGFAPGIRLFDRLPATADGLVVSRPGPCALKVPADHVDILETGHEQLLEWPWTLALEIRCDKPGDGILLSAPAVEIYGGLAWTVSQEGRRRLQHGLGLVRSSGTASPLQSQSPVVAVIEAALPRNQWSRLVLIGEQGRTTIYLDGVRIGTVNIQMVCPIGTIGGHHNDSFVCGIRNLEIWKRAWSAGEVEHWTPKARNWWQSGKNITLGKP